MAKRVGEVSKDNIPRDHSSHDDDRECSGKRCGQAKLLDCTDDTWDHTFGCHQSGLGKPQTCAGYILRGDDAISWRIAVAMGQFDPKQVHSDVDLFGSYYEMAVANGVPPDDPALEGCKP